MVGAVLIVIALVLVLPVVIIMSGGILAGLIGQAVDIDVDITNEGSELVDLNS